MRENRELDAEVVYRGSRDVQRGLHDIGRTQDADLLVVSASREDEIYRDLVGDDARDLLDNPPCPVAVAPVGYSADQASLQTMGVAYRRSPGSDHLLAVARTLAADRHATLFAVPCPIRPGCEQSLACRGKHRWWPRRGTGTTIRSQ